MHLPVLILGLLFRDWAPSFRFFLVFFDWYKYDDAMYFRAEFLDFLHDGLLISDLTELTNEL